MNLSHHVRRLLSIPLLALLLTGCGGGGGSDPEVFTKCNASGAHSADAPSDYRLFPLLDEGVDLVSYPGSHIAVTGTDSKGNALTGDHGEFIDSRRLEYADLSLVSDFRPLTLFTEWRGGTEQPGRALAIDFTFNTSSQNAHVPLEYGEISYLEVTTDVFARYRTITSNQFDLIDSEPIPEMATPGESGSLGTYMSGSDLTLERTWSLKNAKDDLAFLNIQSVLYRTADDVTIFEENIAYQITEDGTRQCVALHAYDRESNFSVRLEGTLQETPVVD